MSCRNLWSPAFDIIEPGSSGEVSDQLIFTDLSMRLTGVTDRRHTLMIYTSDNSDGIDALADVIGIQRLPPGNNITIFETGLGGAPYTDLSNGFDYFPGPAYPHDNEYHGISDAPEATTWAMMLAGFAGLSFAGYRKAKSRTAVSAA
jgi:hypothetical protein